MSEIGKTFKPKGVQTRGSIKDLVNPSQLGGAGKIDYAQSDSEATAGVFTRRLVADPPGGFLFHCQCGHIRRVTGEELNFFCEYSGWTDGKTSCADGKVIQWSRLRKPVEGEIDEEGNQLYEDVTTDETIEVPDEYTGKKRKVKIAVPVFEGRYLGDVKREEMRRRKAAGEELEANPSNMVIQTIVKQQSDGETAGDRVKPKDGKK